MLSNNIKSFFFLFLFIGFALQSAETTSLCHPKIVRQSAPLVSGSSQKNPQQQVPQLPGDVQSIVYANAAHMELFPKAAMMQTYYFFAQGHRAVLPDDRNVWVSEGGAIRAWAAAGQELQIYRASYDYHGKRFDEASFPDGSKIVSSRGGLSSDYVKVWISSKPFLNNYLQKTANPANFLVWLLLEYKDFLQQKYPKRDAIRIQDVAAFAKELQPKRKTTVKSLTALRNAMPQELEYALVKGLKIYSCSDARLDRRVRKFRALKEKCVWIL